MKNLSRTFVIFLIIIHGISSLALCRNIKEVSFSLIKSITAITEVFGDGQKVTTVAVEYDKDILNSKLSKSSFSVKGRTITNVYANTIAIKAVQGNNGKYAIIELSPSDNEAAIFIQKGRTCSSIEAKVSVTQTGDIITTDEEKYPSNTKALTNSKVVNLIVD